MGDQEASALGPGERNQATLAHVLQVMTWFMPVGWIAPLVILLINRNSRFVRFHALQVLFFQILYDVLLVMGIFVPFLTMLFAGMVYLWLWVPLSVVAIVYGVKAARGKWAKYPVLGVLALRVLKISRQGVSFLETLMVVSLLGIVLAASLPSYPMFASNERMRAVAHSLASDLRIARQEAITRRAPVTVMFSRVDPACPGGPAGSYSIRQASTVIKKACFPSDVAWAAFSPVGPLVFEATGTPEAGTELAVASTRTSMIYIVTVAAETGVVTGAP